MDWWRDVIYHFNYQYTSMLSCCEHYLNLIVCYLICFFYHVIWSVLICLPLSAAVVGREGSVWLQSSQICSTLLPVAFPVFLCVRGQQ